jgi:hypothetical protein
MLERAITVPQMDVVGGKALSWAYYQVLAKSSMDPWVEQLYE